MSKLTLTTMRPESLTWDTALRLFKLRCKAQNLAESTQKLYAYDLGLWLTWANNNDLRAPLDTQAAHLRAFLQGRRANGCKDSTVDISYRILRTFWRFLYRDGLTVANPMEKVERPMRERRFIKPFTEEQLCKVLAVMDPKNILNLRDYALTLFLADTGLRLGEALSLKVGDVDWNGNSITVVGKGRKERRVAFGQTARRALTRWLQRRGNPPVETHLWVNKFGQQMKICNFEQRLKMYTRKAGIVAKRLSPHALRHFFALTFLKNGGDVMSLQKLLGHTSLTMVRNYVNMSDDDSIANHRKASPLDRMGAIPGSRSRVVLK